MTGEGLCTSMKQVIRHKQASEAEVHALGAVCDMQEVLLAQRLILEARLTGLEPDLGMDNR